MREVALCFEQARGPARSSRRTAGGSASLAFAASLAAIAARSFLTAVRSSDRCERLRASCLMR